MGANLVLIPISITIWSAKFADRATSWLRTIVTWSANSVTAIVAIFQKARKLIFSMLNVKAVTCCSFPPELAAIAVLILFIIMETIVKAVDYQTMITSKTAQFAVKITSKMIKFAFVDVRSAKDRNACIVPVIFL